MSPEQIGFRFTRIYTPAVLLFLFCNALAGPFLVRKTEALWPHMALACLSALSVLIGAWAMKTVLSDTDEYIRKLTTDALLIAAALTLTLTSAYGYLMSYSAAPSVSLIYIVPVFVAFFAVATAYHIAVGRYK